MQLLDSATWAPGQTSWSAPAALTGPLTTRGSAALPDVSTGGDAVATWLGGGSDTAVILTRSAGGAFATTPVPTGCASPSMAIDDDGDAIQGCATDAGVVVETLDATAPTLRALRAPNHPRARRRQTFHVRALDAWQALAARQITWRLGDGGTATGPTVQHTFRKPGAYTVSVVATDDAGHVSQRLSRRVRVSR
jgi:chitodextrinase